MRPEVEWFRRLLLFNAVLLMLAFPASILPRSWMEWAHRRLQLGTMPEGPLVDYLARSLSLVYGGLGIATWMMARDIPRYRPLLALWVQACLVGSVALWIVDVTSGMPSYWTWGEAAYLLVVGIASGLLLARVPASNGKTLESE